MSIVVAVAFILGGFAALIGVVTNAGAHWSNLVAWALICAGVAICIIAAVLVAGG